MSVASGHRLSLKWLSESQPAAAMSLAIIHRLAARRPDRASGATHSILISASFGAPGSGALTALMRRSLECWSSAGGTRGHHEMGIDRHALNFLRYARKSSEFGRTVTIGRQCLQVAESRVRQDLGLGEDYRNNKYCDELLKDCFGAQSVDSVDNSNFENATIIHDLNLPLPSKQRARFDTVIDAGCLEHVYNLPQALKNLSLLCRPEAQIIHVLPAINFCGHGFWQFSPELFFSLYAAKNGYAQTEVFLAKILDEDRWYRVKPPQHGERRQAYSGVEVYVLVRTVLVNPGFSHDNIQQSDYVYEWSRASADAPVATAILPPSGSTLRDAVKRSRIGWEFLAPAYHSYLNRRKLKEMQVSRVNPGLIELRVGSLL